VEAQVASGDFIQRLAERIGLVAQASAVFGDPVERDGLTVIPVAKATWGVGGGSGEKSGEQGLGGGGGGSISPLGYIEVRDTGAEFKPIRAPRLFAAGASASTVTSTIARIGPSVPRTPQLIGGSMWVTSEVAGRSANPMRRAVTHLSPTAGGPFPSMCPPITFSCHSLNRVGSMTYAKTSAGGRSTSIVETFAAIDLRG